MNKKIVAIFGAFGTAIALAIITPFFPFDEIIAVIIGIGLAAKEILK